MSDECEPVSGCSNEYPGSGKRQRSDHSNGEDNDSQEMVSWMDRLPDELLMEILSFLDPRILGYVTRKVCRRWARLSQDEMLWRQMDLEVSHTDDMDVVYSLLMAAPAFRKLTLWGRCPSWPFISGLPPIQELVLKGPSDNEPERPMSSDSNSVNCYIFSLSNMLPSMCGTLERLTVLGEVREEEFRHIDELDLRELRMVNDDLRDYPCVDRPRRRRLEYVHFEKDGHLCFIPIALLRQHKDSLRTVVGRVDQEGMQALAECSQLESADIDVPNVASLALLDELQGLHTLRVSFRLSPQPRVEAHSEDRVAPLHPHCSQRVRRLSIYQMPTTPVLSASLSDVLTRYQDHLECLEIGRITFRINYHGIEVMRVIDRMDNLKVLFLGSSGWPDYPLALRNLELVRADVYSDWITTCLHSSRKHLKKVICDDIPEIVCEQWLSQCECLEETVIDLSSLRSLNGLRHVRTLTLQFSDTSFPDMLQAGAPTLARVTALTAEAIRGTSYDEEILTLLAANCPQLKALHLRGWGRVVAFGHWLSQFPTVEELTLDLTLPFYQNLIYGLIAGEMPNLKTLVFEDQEGESGVGAALESLQDTRPHLRIMGSWSEAEPLPDEDFPVHFADEEG